MIRNEIDGKLIPDIVGKKNIHMWQVFTLQTTRVALWILLSQPSWTNETIKLCTVLLEHLLLLRRGLGVGHSSSLLEIEWQRLRPLVHQILKTLPCSLLEKQRLSQELYNQTLCGCMTISGRICTAIAPCRRHQQCAQRRAQIVSKLLCSDIGNLVQPLLA